MKTRKEENLTVKAPDLTILDKTYENKWVALSCDYKKILAVGDKLADVLKIKQANKVVMKVLPQLGYAPIVF
jgi:hypothetical protein